MIPTSRHIAALLGSRICHDLISPIGAISNGVELMQMSGADSSPELALISESVDSANARIRFFRIAFGMASADQMVGAQEIRDTLRDVCAGGRLRVDWQSDLDQPRNEVKLIFLMILCLETAMPWGGHITVQNSARKWTVSGTSDRMKVDPQVWSALQGEDAEIGAAEVQFLLVPAMLDAYDRSLNLEMGESSIIANL